MSMKKPEGSNWWDYLSGKKTDPRPAIPAFKADEPAPGATHGIEVQESFMDTIKMTAWKALGGKR